MSAEAVGRVLPLESAVAPRRQCSRCILDDRDDPRLNLDAEGVCNYCREYDALATRLVFTGAEGEARLQALVNDIQRAGKGKRYDCIIGISGGVDSTYLAYLARRRGLRPLAVHMDNGWNSELAVSNIENIVKRLDLDLQTYVVDWEEFRDVQLAYLKASVIDIEAVTDHAIAATVHRLAREHGIRFILSGTNVATEAILPTHWIFNKLDHVNLQAIHRRYGKVSLRTFPIFGWTAKMHARYVGRVRAVSPLNLVPYVKSAVREVIARELGWRDYGVKHGESVFTRFYQCYILPTKFGVDKRKAHLSNLVCSGQLSRSEAIAELGQPLYEPERLKLDTEFVLKKLGLSYGEFEGLMGSPPRSHFDFPVEGGIRRHPLLSPVRRAYHWYKRRRSSA